MEKHTPYENARILGARALQIAMDAPFLIDISKEKLEEIKHNPMEIAKLEFESGVLPISVKKPMPKKKAVAMKKVVEKEINDKNIAEKEEKEEDEIVKEGEIMELANPEDEDNYEEDERNEELQ